MAYKHDKPRESNGSPFYVYGLILILAISIYMLSGILAKYVTSGRSADGAGTAGFDITFQTASNNQLLVNLGEENDSDDYPFSISNHSEVEVEYDLNIRFPASPQVQDWITIQILPLTGNLDDADAVKGEPIATIVTEKNKREYTVDSVDHISIGETKKYCLRFAFDDGNYMNYDYKNIEISAKVIQID